MPATLWMSNFGTGDAAVDIMDNLEDGTGPDNIWSAYRVNVLKDGVLAIQNLLINGSGTFPDLSGVTSQLNARWFGSLEHTGYYKKTDEINATTLGGHSDYWRVATSQGLIQGLCIDQKNPSSGAAYSFAYNYPTPFTQFVSLSRCVTWYQAGNGGRSPGDVITYLGDGYDSGGYNTAWLPYYPSGGGVIFSELRITMSNLRWSVGSHGINGEHRVFVDLVVRGI